MTDVTPELKAARVLAAFAPDENMTDEERAQHDAEVIAQWFEAERIAARSNLDRILLLRGALQSIAAWAGGGGETMTLPELVMLIDNWLEKDSTGELGRSIIWRDRTGFEGVPSEELVRGLVTARERFLAQLQKTMIEQHPIAEELRKRGVPLPEEGWLPR